MPALPFSQGFHGPAWIKSPLLHIALFKPRSLSLHHHTDQGAAERVERLKLPLTSDPTEGTWNHFRSELTNVYGAFSAREGQGQRKDLSFGTQRLQAKAGEGQFCHSIWHGFISMNWMLKSVIGVVYGAHSTGICTLPQQEADFTPW